MTLRKTQFSEGADFYANAQTAGIKLNGGYVQPNINISDDGRGVLESSITIFMPPNPEYKSMVDQAPKKGDSHPIDARLKCYKTATAYQKNGITVITADYIGLRLDPSEPEVELTSSTSESPIQTHPRFKSWALTKSTPPVVWKQYVRKSDSNEFEGFGSGSPNKLEGVESYLTPANVVRVTQTMSRVNDVNSWIYKLGRIAYPPVGGSKVDINGNQMGNFLLTNVSVTEYGTVYRVCMEFTCSGGGNLWNNSVYQS
jgi:hypothetical protein